MRTLRTEMFVISVKNRFTGKTVFHNLSDIITSSFMKERAGRPLPDCLWL